MSIESAITAAQGRVADAYTAISNKGGTLPATQNLANMPTAINSITGLVGETRTEQLNSTSGNTYTPSSGYNGIVSITVTPKNYARTVAPQTTQSVWAVPSGYSGHGNITVSAVTASIDANITAGNIKSGVSILGVTGTYGGGGGDFQLTRVKDDNNNEIGTHICNFTDGNGNTYKVVLLDAQYRDANTKWMSSTALVTNMPVYTDLATSNVWEAKETATQNTQLILDYCTANSYTSSACTHCRSQSFVIDGVTYYGQLPNEIEVFKIAKNYHAIEIMDTSASANPSLNFSASRSVWSSNQVNSANCWRFNNLGTMSTTRKNEICFACPVLEIPL